MDAFGLTLLIIAALLAFSVVFARLEHRPLDVSSSQLKEALSLARRAAVTFWVTFVLAAAVGAFFAAFVLGDVGEWGPLFTFVAVVVASAVFGAVAALSHGVAVLILLGTYSVMDATHRKAASAVTAIGVLLVVLLVLLPGVEDRTRGTPFILSWVTLPLRLSIPVIALAVTNARLRARKTLSVRDDI